jgi:glutamate carboxypeptidase
MRVPSSCLLILALSLACATTALAAPDEKLKAAAEAAQPALIDTLREMVLIESGSGDVEGLRKMADFTEARLKALGAKTERRKTRRAQARTS